MNPTNVTVGPRLRIVHATGRWGEPQPSWYVTNCGTVPAEKWAKIQDFQRLPTPGDGTEEAMAARRQQIERKLGHNPEGMTTWQLYLCLEKALCGHDRSCTSYIRALACLGEKRIVRWSWFDIHVHAPALRAIAWLLTKLQYNPEF